MRIMRFLGLVVLLCLTHTAHAQMPGEALKMGTIYCPGATMNCSDIITQQEKIIANANSCIETRLSIPQPIMTSFKVEGAYENCVIADRPFKDTGGFDVWVTCCLKKAKEDSCEMECTRYINQQK